MSRPLTSLITSNPHISNTKNIINIFLSFSIITSAACKKCMKMSKRELENVRDERIKEFPEHVCVSALGFSQ